MLKSTVTLRLSTVRRIQDALNACAALAETHAHSINADIHLARALGKAIGQCEAAESELQRVLASDCEEVAS